MAYIGSGGGGNGTLFYRGGAYPFTVGGLGIGGIGVSTIDAEGEVYKLKGVASFGGAYAQARYGFAIGTTSGGDLWLQNEAGVIMHLKAKRDRPDAQPGRRCHCHIDAVDMKLAPTGLVVSGPAP